MKPSEAVRAKFTETWINKNFETRTGGVASINTIVRIIAYLEELEKEEFMTQNGLGDTDMINDNKPPQEI